MNIPNFMDVTAVGKDGKWSNEWRNIWMQLFQQLQLDASDEGLVVPSQSTSNITILEASPNTQEGTLIFDSDTNELKVDINGVFQTITTGSSTSLTWQVVTNPFQQMLVNHGYIADRPSSVMLQMPPLAVVGDIVRVVNVNSGGMIIALNAGQVINFGNVPTSAGPVGQIDSTDIGDALEMLCTATDTTFFVLAAQGNLIVV